MDNLEINLSDTKTKKPMSVAPNKSKKKKIACITTFVIGIIMLIVGAVFLVMRLTGQSEVADGEYLVSAENWALENAEEQVVWDFTEVGKGILTTDGHEHDYEFMWELEDGKLLIRTDWLYELDNTYEYKLDQSNGVLTLTDDDGEYMFVAQP